MNRQKETTHGESVARGHEQADIDFNRILYIGFGLLGLMAVGLFYSQFVERVFSETTSSPGAPSEVLIVPDTTGMPPEPRLESSPNSNLVRYRAWEDSILTGYGWEDREKGIVHIPVDRAMEKIAGETN